MSERKRSTTRDAIQQDNPLGYHESTFKGLPQYVCDTCGAAFFVSAEGETRDIVVHLRDHDAQKTAAARQEQRQVVSPLVDAAGQPITRTVASTTPPEGDSTVTPADEPPTA
jgi:hypothetical protein